MNPFCAVTGEHQGSTSASPGGGVDPPPPPRPFMLLPEPMEGLHDPGPPLFLTRTFDIVEDPSTNHIVSWGRGGTSFVVSDPYTFSANLLPRYFKHNNFSSFIRQLNTYGFRKIDPDRWEFANEAFLMGHRHLLKNIRRRKSGSQSFSAQNSEDPCDTSELERLKRDRRVLMLELIKLRHQQQSTRAYMTAMEQRLESAEKKQRQMMSFLARAMRNPEFLSQLLEQRQSKRVIEDAATKKRRRRLPMDQGSSEVQNPGLVIPVVKTEPVEFGFEISELEALALEMQGYGSRRTFSILEEDGYIASSAVEVDGHIEPEEADRVLDEGFWEELLSNERLGEGEDLENVDVLADRLGYLSSSPK